MTSRALNSAPAPATPARTRRLLALGYGLLAGLLAGVLWFAVARPVQVLPRIRPAPAFTLTDAGGRWLGAEELRGRVVLLSFGYTRCGVECAALEERLLAARDGLAQAGLLGQEVALVTISVDPEHDTPATLRRYAARLGADERTWRFLTGAPAEIKEVVGGGFHVYYAPRTPGGAGPPLELDQRAVLVDGSGVIRAEYGLAQLEVWRVLRDVELVRREAASSGWERPVYDAAHLFVCYPN
ncbi:MAG TPA: SCO family protein [Roseiflexaceae bacterium]|nr:SCO family protein [Roseiflexaceae bacterium]